MVVTETEEGEEDVTGLANRLRFDSTGTLVRDSTFEASIEEIKSMDRKLISGIEYVTLDDPAEVVDETRAKLLLEVLKETGVAKTRATLNFRVADDKENEMIKRLGEDDVAGGFVLKR
jgi:hypothetical protein